MSYTGELAEYVATLRFDALPNTTIRAAKRVTLDLLGVLFPATRYEPGLVMNEYVRDLGGTPQATVVGTDIQTSTVLAALANGTMAADMEQDDVHPEAGTHPSSVYIPAMLAVAEAADLSGQEWITGLVAAYDLGSRLSIALDHERVYARGFHPTAITGTFGATAGAARLLNLDAEAVNSAIGLAGCQAAGMMTWELEQEHFTKSFQSGVPARNAVTAAELAYRGYVGAADTLDGQYNVFDAFSSHRDFTALVADLGVRFEIERTGFKFYSCCRNIHATLDIVFDLLGEHRFGPDDIEAITVWLPETLAAIVDNRALTTHNLQFIVAAAITDGEVTRVQTSATRRADEKLNELATRITLHGDPELQTRFPQNWPARVALQLRDGRRFEVEREDPRGNPTMPVTDADLEAKFARMATQVISDEAARSIVSCVASLDALPSIRELTSLLRVPSLAHARVEAAR